VSTDRASNTCATFRWASETLSVGPLPEDSLKRLGRLVGIAPTIGSVAQNHIAINLCDNGLRVLDHRAPLLPSLEAVVMYLARHLPQRMPTPAGHHLLHGGAVVRDGMAWAILGPGRAGKSTLVLEAWLNGAEVIGDDMFLLDAAAGTVAPAPKPLKVRLAEPCPPARLRGLPPEDCALGPVENEQDTALLLGRLLPRITPLETTIPLGGAFLLRRVPEPGWRTEPVAKVQLIQAVFAETRVSSDRALTVLHPFMDLLKNGRVQTLVVGECASAQAATMLCANGRSAAAFPLPAAHGL
jgi:hypothetical protein